MERAKGLLCGLLACLFLSFLLGCKGKQTVVESVRYVHDTAYSVRDSIVYRTMTFGGTVEEREAEWTSKGDSASNTPDTVWRYRYRTVTAQGKDSSHTEVRAASGQQRTDSTATVTTKGRAKPEKQASGKGMTAWTAALWLLSVVAAFAGGVVFGRRTRKK